MLGQEAGKQRLDVTGKLGAAKGSGRLVVGGMMHTKMEEFQDDGKGYEMGGKR